MVKSISFCFLFLITSICLGQISNDPIYTYKKESGIYCKVPLIKWVTPTVQAIQDRFDLQDFGITLDSLALVKMFNNISDSDLAFDFYYPKESKSKLKPLIIFAHGGAFLVGGRESRSITLLCKEFAQRGYATASIEYRLKAINTFDMVEAGYMALQDGNAAIKYFRANAAKYGIDPNKIFIAGNSAGAMLALHSGHYDKGEDLLGQANRLDNALGCFGCTGDYVTVDNSVTGVINIVGATTSPSIINSNLPTLHIYCPNDQVVPANTGIPLSNYKAVGNFGNIFAPILQKIKRPPVYGPIYLKKNLGLPKHKFVDITKYSSGSCSHNIFMGDNGVPKSSGKEAIYIINDWIKNLAKPNVSLPVRTLSTNSWTKYSLPSTIVSHSVASNDAYQYRKLNSNSFEIKPLKVGQSSFDLNVKNDLGLSQQSTVKFSASSIVGDNSIDDTTDSNNTTNKLKNSPYSNNRVILFFFVISMIAIAIFLNKKNVF